VGRIPKKDLRLITISHSLGFSSFFMARAAILGVVTFRAVYAYIPRVIFIIIFGNQVIQIVMTSTAALFSSHAFHAFNLHVFMMAGRARLPDIFTKMVWMIKDDFPIIRVKKDGFG
jgi:hypothetical protein